MSENKTLRVFMVEDNGSVRRIWQTVIGHRFSPVQFVEAKFIDEALEQFKRYKGDFNVILMDGRLPQTQEKRVSEEGNHTMDLIRFFISEGYDAQKIVPASGSADFNLYMEKLGCFPNEAGKATAARVACALLAEQVEAQNKPGAQKRPEVPPKSRQGKIRGLINH